MRVLLCSKNSLLANIAVNRLLPALSGHSVTLLLANRARSVADSEQEYRLMKLLDEDVPSRVLFPLLDGNSHMGRFGSYGQLTSRHGCDLITFNNMSRDGLSDTLLRVRPDLILSVVFGFLFRPRDIAVPRCGIINLHTGPLPQMPGLHAVFWCMRRRMTHATLTAHYVDAGIDSGPVIDSRQVALDYAASLYDNLAACYQAGGEFLGELARHAARHGRLSSTPQDPAARGPRLRYPDRAELDAFAASGGRWLDEAAYVRRLERDYLDGVPVDGNRGG